MGNTPSSHRVSAQDKAILDMKNQRDKLHQYQRKITVLTARETAIARQLLAQNNKPGALLALRRKKYQESLLAQTDAQLEQLEKLTASVEFAQVQKDVVFGLQQGTKVLNEIHKEMGGIDQVEKLMGENEEARAYQREISEMLGGRISNQDEDEVEDELEALEGEVGAYDSIAGVNLPAVPTMDLPNAPISEVSEEGEARRKARAKARSEAARAAQEALTA